MLQEWDKVHEPLDCFLFNSSENLFFYHEKLKLFSGKDFVGNYLEPELWKVIVKVVQSSGKRHALLLWKTDGEEIVVELVVLDWGSWEIIEDLSWKSVFGENGFVGIHGAGTGQTTQVLDAFFEAGNFGIKAKIKIAVVLVAFSAVETVGSVEFKNGEGMGKAVAIGDF